MNIDDFYESTRNINDYNSDKILKQYKGPLSMVSELESICENEKSPKQNSESLKGSIHQSESGNSDRDHHKQD